MSASNKIVHQNENRKKINSNYNNCKSNYRRVCVWGGWWEVSGMVQRKALWKYTKYILILKITQLYPCK